jgi:Sporulation and spore germination
VQGEQLVHVARPGTTPTDAVRQLMAGTTRSEARRGLRTYVPAGTPVHSVTVAGGLATVDLGARFTRGHDAGRLLARLSQLVRTVTGLQRTVKVQLLIDGAAVSGVFPGVPTASPITFRYLQTPNVPMPTPPPARLPAPDEQTRRAQRRLIALGYLGKGAADGRLGL